MHILHIHGKKKKNLSGSTFRFLRLLFFFFFKHLSSVWVPQNEAKGSRVLPSTMDSTPARPLPAPLRQNPEVPALA